MNLIVLTRNYKVLNIKSKEANKTLTLISIECSILRDLLALIESSKSTIRPLLFGSFDTYISCCYEFRANEDDSMP